MKQLMIYVILAVLFFVSGCDELDNRPNFDDRPTPFSPVNPTHDCYFPCIDSDKSYRGG